MSTLALWCTSVIQVKPDGRGGIADLFHPVVDYCLSFTWKQFFLPAPALCLRALAYRLFCIPVAQHIELFSVPDPTKAAEESTTPAAEGMEGAAEGAAGTTEAAAPSSGEAEAAQPAAAASTDETASPAE